MTEGIDYDKVIIVSRDDIILIEFLLLRLNELPTWTKKKHALLEVIKQRLAQLNAYTYLGASKNLNKIGDWECGSSFNGFFKGTPREGFGFFQLVVGYSKTSKSARNIALMADIDKDLPFSSELFRITNSVTYDIHALWVSSSFERRVFELLREKIKLVGYLEFGREDKGIGARWWGLEVVGEDKILMESLYQSLEGLAPDLIDVGGFDPEIKIHLIQPELLAIEIIDSQ